MTGSMEQEQLSRIHSLTYRYSPAMSLFSYRNRFFPLLFSYYLILSPKLPSCEVLSSYCVGSVSLAPSFINDRRLFVSLLFIDVGLPRLSRILSYRR